MSVLNHCETVGEEGGEEEGGGGGAAAGAAAPVSLAHAGQAGKGQRHQPPCETCASWPVNWGGDPGPAEVTTSLPPWGRELQSLYGENILTSSLLLVRNDVLNSPVSSKSHLPVISSDFHLSVVIL